MDGRNFLEWNGKVNTGIRYMTGPDLSITKLTTKNSQLNGYSFRFRNNSFLRFTKNNIMVFAGTENRIYFKSENPSIGYTLSTFSKDGSKCSARIKTPKNLDKFIGDYDLLWDGQVKMNYIDLLKKKTPIEQNLAFEGKKTY